MSLFLQGAQRGRRCGTSSRTSPSSAPAYTGPSTFVLSTVGVSTCVLSILGWQDTHAGSYHAISLPYIQIGSSFSPPPPVMRRIFDPPPCTPNPKPYTRHPKPTPYTRHPTPDTLHPIPYTLHPTLYTLHITSSILNPTRLTLHPKP